MACKKKPKQIINMDCFLLIKVSENCFKIIEKSGNFLLSGEWQPCLSFTRAVVKLLSKASRRLRLLSSVIGFKNLPPVFQLSGSKTKTNGILYARVCRALSGLRVFVRNSDWFIALLAPVVIGRSNYFCFLVASTVI